MSGTLTTCCCGGDGPTCPPSACDLASAYSLAISAQFTYAGFGTIPAVADDCGNGGTVSLAVSGLVVTENTGTCGCFGERYPPVTGAEAYNARSYAVTTGAAPTLSAASSGTTCSWANCGTVSGSAIAGTWAGGSHSGLPFCSSLGAFGIVNETNADTGLNVWYWRVALQFTSTATVTCAGVTLPTWTAWISGTSEPQPDCHGPEGLTWSGVGDGLPLYPRWHESWRTGLVIRHVIAGTAYGCQCTYGAGSFYYPPGVTQNAFAVAAS